MHFYLFSWVKKPHPLLDILLQKLEGKTTTTLVPLNVLLTIGALYINYEQLIKKLDHLPQIAFHGNLTMCVLKLDARQI